MLQYCFCFILWFFGFQACGILASRPEIKPTPPMLEGGVLTTGPPGKAPRYVLLISDAQVFSCNRKEKPDSDGDDEETTGARMASLRCASLEANPTPSSWRLGVPPVRLSPQTLPLPTTVDRWHWDTPCLPPGQSDFQGGLGVISWSI